MFGDSDLVSLSRLKRMAAKPEEYSIFRWDEKTSKLVSVELPSRDESKSSKLLSGKAVEHITPGGKLELHPFVQSTDYDFLSMNLTLSRSAKQNSTQQAPPAVVVTWYRDGDDLHPWKSVIVDLKDTDKPQTAECSLSEHKSWLGVGQVGKITIELPGNIWSADLKDIALESAQIHSPVLSLDGNRRNSAGSRPSEDVRGVTWSDK